MLYNLVYTYSLRGIEKKREREREREREKVWNKICWQEKGRQYEKLDYIDFVFMK